MLPDDGLDRTLTKQNCSVGWYYWVRVGSMFVFVFACPFNDSLCIAVWYSPGGGTIVRVSRALLPRLLKW